MNIDASHQDVEPTQKSGATETLTHKLSNSLSISYLNFTLSAQENILLPSYKGAVFRGGFGYTLRKISCISKIHRTCEECALHSNPVTTCSYSYLFQTHNSPKLYNNRMKKITEIPRPFVIDPPNDTKTTYTKGESFQIGFLLFGNAIKYYPYIVFTIYELGKTGVGKWRGKYRIAQITNYKNEKIYNPQNHTLINTQSHQIPLNEILANLPTHPINSIKINFLTPLRIKNNSKLIYTTPSFRTIVSALLHRISSLSYFHCNKELTINYKTLLEKTESIKAVQSNLKWQDWERYSTRQKTKMKLGGLTGEITYEGDIKPYLPLLVTGQYTHIGKNCTFGLGKYQICMEQ